jgi:hypothetical protein
MKRFALVISLLMLFQSAAFAIGPTYSGSWFNPDQSGHGFSLEYSVLDDESPLVVAYWYVYDSEGNPIYLIGNGEPEEGNTVTLEFEAPYGMKFGEFDPESTVREDGGTGVFAFENEESGTFDYEPSVWIADAYGLSAISIPVKKLLGVAHPNDEPPPIVPPPTGDPVPVLGSWSGRMVYDRRSTGTCYDADVSIVVIKDPYPTTHTIDSFIVFRDSGGLDNVGVIGRMDIESGSVTSGFTMFDTTTDYSLQFNTQGSAQGYWNYGTYEDDCYGEWTFTKD